jgi:hypothetical protein
LFPDPDLGMLPRMLRSLLIPVLALAACGGASAIHHEDQPVTAAAEKGHDEEHKKIAGGPLDAFHEVLGPLWHAPEGPTRTTQTCATVPSFKERAAAAASLNGGAELVASVDALDKACAAPARPDFQARFSAVHDTFHHAVEKLP